MRTAAIFCFALGLSAAALAAPPPAPEGYGYTEPIPGTRAFRYVTDRVACISSRRDHKCRREEYQGYEYVLQLPEPGLIQKVLIEAHDSRGNWHRAGLKVLIEGREIQEGSYLDLQSRPRTERWYGLSTWGRDVILEEVRGDEAIILRVEVEFIPQGFGGDGGWVAYPEANGCIGGRRCGRNGNQLELHLDDRPVQAIRFFAHDDVGNRGKARMRVSLDRYILEPNLDVLKRGESYEIPLDGRRGRYLIFEVLNDDEVVLEDIEVRYSGSYERRRRR